VATDLTEWRNEQIGSSIGPGVHMSSRFGQSTETAAIASQSGSNVPHVHWQPSPEPYCSGLQVQVLGTSATFFTLNCEVITDDFGRTFNFWYKYDT
jgi:hypothetical protein